MNLPKIFKMPCNQSAPCLEAKIQSRRATLERMPSERERKSVEIRSSGNVSKNTIFTFLEVQMADQQTIHLFQLYMSAKQKKTTVPKFIRDKLMLTMHYIHRYQIRELKQMFQVSVQTLRNFISKQFVQSDLRMQELSMISQDNLLKQKIIHQVNEFIQTKRKRVTVKLLKQQILSNLNIDVSSHILRQILK